MTATLTQLPAPTTNPSSSNPSKARRRAGWILSALPALFLGFGKRHAELRSVAGADSRQRPVLAHYPIAYLDYLLDKLNAIDEARSQGIAAPAA